MESHSQYKRGLPILFQNKTTRKRTNVLPCEKPTIKNQMKIEIAEQSMTSMIGLLSQAIDILRNYDAEDDANYIESEMEKTIQNYKENK